MEDYRKYEIPEENKNKIEKFKEEYEKTKNEKPIMLLPPEERAAYLEGYIDGMKYILENEKLDFKRSNGFSYISTK